MKKQRCATPEEFWGSLWAISEGSSYKVANSTTGEERYDQQESANGNGASSCDVGAISHLSRRPRGGPARLLPDSFLTFLKKL